jgi:catechol 2,3-dioxygenase-like lactoylglutathione lyase family enzyme
MLADRISYVALVSSDPATTSQVLERHFGLQRQVLKSPEGHIDVFPVGQSALALFPQGHALVEGEAKTGVHHIALCGSAEKERQPGLAGRAIQRLPRERTAGVRLVITEPLELDPPATGTLQRIDHIGVASTDVMEDERIFAGELGFKVESRQTDMEVSMPVESFTSDKYGVIYHSRPPEPLGGLRVTFITVGDCELEFLANFDPRQGGEVEHGRSGTTRQDQGAIARFVASRGRGLHHVAVKAHDIDSVLRQMADAGLPMIDKKGRPGSRRALIGFPHPRALGGVLMHVVQRPDS